ncbi:MAG: divalent-cation tolerance protein CutA [Longimicrobiales bacterium]
MTTQLVLCTAPDTAATQQLVRTLVEERLVACGNIVRGITSIYRWQGAIDQADEALIIFKTTTEAWPRLKQRVVELHPYDVPELLMLSLDDGYKPYLDWVADSMQSVNE